MGSFRPKKFIRNLHRKFKFTRMKKMTAGRWLLDSCWTTIISQGISLHYDAQE